MRRGRDEQAFVDEEPEEQQQDVPVAEQPEVEAAGQEDAGAADGEGGAVAEGAENAAPEAAPDGVSRDAVVKELWETIQALEEDREVMAERMESLYNALINAQEDGAAYREQHEKIHAEGQTLYQSYQTKCERVKALQSENERAKKAAEEEAELTATRARLEAAVATAAASPGTATGEEAAVTDGGAAGAPAAAHSPAESSANTDESPLSVDGVALTVSADGMSADELASKLESAAISNEVLRAEVERQKSQAQLAARASAAQLESLGEQLKKAIAEGAPPPRRRHPARAEAERDGREGRLQLARTSRRCSRVNDAPPRPSPQQVKSDADATKAAMVELPRRARGRSRRPPRGRPKSRARRSSDWRAT